MKNNVELNCGVSEQTYSLKRKNKPLTLISGTEAAMLEWIRELPLNDIIRLLKIEIKDLQEYTQSRIISHKEYCIHLLSKKWYSRECDTKLELTKFEFEDLNFRNGSKLKQQCKKDQLSIAEMNVIIELFTNDNSDWYTK